MAPTPWHNHWFPSPRRWQAEALDAVQLSLEQGPKPVVVQAVMGSGKSIVIAELCYLRPPEKDERIVVTAPTIALVDQLSATVSKRLGKKKVGRFYTYSKDTAQPVIVACNASAVKLAETLQAKGLSCTLWIGDEIHRTEIASLHEAHELLQPARAVGFTATPYRSGRAESLSLWKKEAYSYGPKEALEDGVIVPWRVVTGNGYRDLDRWCMGKIKEAEGPGVANARSIKDAHWFAKELRQEAGVIAFPIHSLQDEEIFGRLKKSMRLGWTKCMVHVSMLQEGVDIPFLRWMCLRREVGSRVRFAQEVGRALRASPDKTEAVIYDPHGLFKRHSLSYEAALGGEALVGQPKRKSKARKKKQQQVAAPPVEEWHVTLKRWWRGLKRSKRQ